MCPQLRHPFCRRPILRAGSSNDATKKYLIITLLYNDCANSSNEHTAVPSLPTTTPAAALASRMASGKSNPAAIANPMPAITVRPRRKRRILPAPVSVGNAVLRRGTGSCLLRCVSGAVPANPNCAATRGLFSCKSASFFPTSGNLAQFGTVGGKQGCTGVFGVVISFRVD